MALETASYVANLVVTNPDGADARSTADDHLRLIKASLKRTFPLLDSAVSLSAAQVHFVGDLSKSAQAQLNTLRDGSATANFALGANSASVAANIGSIPAARVMDLAAAPNQMSGDNPIQLTHSQGYVSWAPTGLGRVGFIQMTRTGVTDNFRMRLAVETSSSFAVEVNGSARLTINPDGTVTIPGLITGHISSASYAVSAGTAATADNATNANAASLANFATTCTSASSAATLAGISSSESGTASSIAKRNSAGDLFARYFNQSSGLDNVSVGHVACMTALDGYWRPNTVANLGTYMDARNITGKSGTAKTLASGTGPPSLSGSTNGDLFFYY